MTQQEFIEKIAPLHIKYAKKYGFKIVSGAIAQACLESAYGTSSKAKHNNFYGLKYRKNRVTVNNGTFVDGSSEQTSSGAYVAITDQWYNFDTMENGVEGYYQFINISSYAKAKTATTAQSYLQALKDAGYATSIKYVQNNMNVVNKWNLTKYDAMLNTEIKKEESTTMNIIQKNGTANTSARGSNGIKYIVLHYTAGTKSAKGTAANTAAYFAKSTTKASADFICDDETIVQYNADPAKRYCWAVGGNKLSSSTGIGGSLYGKCTNANSISIEMCSRKTNTHSLKASDDDWYLTEATVNNALELTKYLMKKYNIDADHVIMHHHVTGKLCPQPWCKNQAAIANYNNFIKKLKGENAGAPTPAPTPTPVPTPTPAPATTNYVVKITANELNVRKGPGTNYPITAKVRKNQKYTIVGEVNGWGKLKSGAGYIKLSYTKKC